jgi:hypothetical protein
MAKIHSCLAEQVSEAIRITVRLVREIFAERHADAVTESISKRRETVLFNIMDQQFGKPSKWRFQTPVKHGQCGISTLHIEPEVAR